MAKQAKSTPKPILRAPFRALGNGLVWLLIAGAPLVVVVTADNAFRLPKLLASEWLGLASLVAYALAAAVDPDAGRSRPWWRAPAFLAVVPVALAASVGLATGDHPALTREALIDLWVGAACLVGWSLALGAGRLERFVRGLGVPASLVAALGILQFHGLFRPFRFISGVETSRIGVTSLAGNPGDLGAFLVLPAVVAQWGLADGRAKGSRKGMLLWSAVLAITVYGIVVTQTLTAIAALLAGSALFWLLRLPARRGIALAAAGALAAGLLAVAVPPVRHRLAGVGERIAEGDWNAALTGRLDGWRAALWMFGEHPLVGVGHGGYRAEYAPAKLALQDEGVEFYPGHADPFFANAHDDLLEAAAEWGLVGLAALAWALFVLARTLRRWRAADDPGDGGSLAVAGVAAGLVLALGHFPFHLALVAYPYLVFLAWVFRRGEEADGAVEGGGESSGWRRIAALAPWVVAAVIALALVAQTGRAKDRLSASRKLRVVKAVSGEMARAGRVPEQLTGGNFRLLREAEREDPTDIGIPTALAGQYMLLERWDQAIAVYREALATEPRPEIYLNLGQALRESGRDEEAREAFEKAVRLAPRLRDRLPPGVTVSR